jgi:hypothetical protein
MKGYLVTFWGQNLNKHNVLDAIHKINDAVPNLCVCTHVIVGPCHHGMARPQAAVEERSPVWRVALNMLNKRSLTADKGWSSSLGVGQRPPYVGYLRIY